MSEKFIRPPGTIRGIIGFECSQVVMQRFLQRGFDVYSCDLQPCKGPFPERHLQGDISVQLYEHWDFGIFHPPCTYLSYVGKKYWHQPGRVFRRLYALQMFAECLYSNIRFVAVENPLGIVDHVLRKHDQIIQPYFFGDASFKRTCIWLNNLPPLLHTRQKNLFDEQTHIDQPDPIYITKAGDRLHFTGAISGAKENSGWLRSVTFPGIADAMASQWGDHILDHI